jgi:hypothetical protein
MRRNAGLGRLAVAAVVVMGISSVSLGALAGQTAPAQGTEKQETTPKQDTQKNQEMPTQGSQTQGTPGKGTEEKPTASQPAPGVGQAMVVKASATVEKIDKSAGTLTLKGADGRTFDVKAGPNVDMDRLNMGDRVNVTYFDETAVSFRKHTEGAPTAPKVATTTVLRGGVAAQQASLTAKIDSVNVDKKTITFKGSEGKTHTIKVEDPALQAQLGKIRPGDNMDVTYTQAVALSVEPPAPAPTPAPSPAK